MNNIVKGILCFIIGNLIIGGGLFIVSLFESIYIRTLMLFFPTIGAMIMMFGIILITQSDTEANHSQQKNMGNNTNTSPTVPLKVNELSEVGCDGDLPSTADTLRGCGKKLPVKKRQVRDSLYCNKNQLCDSCSNNKTKGDEE